MWHQVRILVTVTICILTSTNIVASASPTTTTTSASSTVTPLLQARSDANFTMGVASLEFYQDEEEPGFTVETFVTIFVTLMIILTNCTILMVAAWTEAFTNFNTTFIYSLTLADLLIGIFITPYSIFLSVYRKWVFTSDMFCSVEAYAYTVLIMAKMYSLTWLNVDHYVAVRKPERYEVMMSSTRSLCWISFSWMVAISYCCPLLFSFESATFSESTFVCMVDSTQKMAYTLTAWALTSLPSVMALAITNAYLFTKSFKRRIQFYEKVFVDLSSRPRNYQITFVMCALFAFVWTPFLVIFLVQEITEADLSHKLQFYFFWLGVSSSFGQFFVLLIMSGNFRLALWDLCQLPGFCRVCNRDSNTEPVDVNVITLPKKR